MTRPQNQHESREWCAIKPSTMHFTFLPNVPHPYAHYYVAVCYCTGRIQHEYKRHKIWKRTAESTKITINVQYMFFFMPTLWKNLDQNTPLVGDCYSLILTLSESIISMSWYVYVFFIFFQLHHLVAWLLNRITIRQTIALYSRSSSSHACLVLSPRLRSTDRRAVRELCENAAAGVN